MSGKFESDTFKLVYVAIRDCSCAMIIPNLRSMGVGGCGRDELHDDPHGSIPVAEYKAFQFQKIQGEVPSNNWS